MPPPHSLESTSFDLAQSPGGEVLSASKFQERDGLTYLLLLITVPLLDGQLDVLKGSILS